MCGPPRNNGGKVIPDRAAWDLGHKADMGAQPGPCNLREGHREQCRKGKRMWERGQAFRGGWERGQPMIRGREMEPRARLCSYIPRAVTLMDSEEGGKHALQVAWETSFI